MIRITGMIGAALVALALSLSVAAVEIFALHTDHAGSVIMETDKNRNITWQGQRYYDPLAGRFLSVDSMAVDIATAWNFNRYSYANNNPYKFTDPDGRAAAACLLPGIMQARAAAVVKTAVAIGAAGAAIGIVKTAGQVNHALNEIGDA